MRSDRFWRLEGGLDDWFAWAAPRLMVSEGLESNMSNRTTYLMYTILNASICAYICICIYIYI